jgi:tRNA(Ile)-lysidine synthetase-like protein
MFTLWHNCYYERVKIDIKPGKYVVAVSGGVDSMVLLDLLRLEPRAQVIVAHFDHGIRPDSHLDREFVQHVAMTYHLPFVYDRAELGLNASEAKAREARYEFLHKARVASGADAVVTAHHQDDLLETALINLLRGTGRKGLSSLKSTDTVVRPLLHASKGDIKDYARRHGLTWREDSTNSDTRYLRNHVRHNVLAKMDAHQRAQLKAIAARMQAVNSEIDTLLEATLQPELSREWFNGLPHAVAREVLASWLRLHNVRDFDRKLLERTVVAAKVAQPNRVIDVAHGSYISVGKDNLALKPQER